MPGHKHPGPVTPGVACSARPSQLAPRDHAGRLLTPPSPRPSPRPRGLSLHLTEPARGVGESLIHLEPTTRPGTLQPRYPESVPSPPAALDACSGLLTGANRSQRCRTVVRPGLQWRCRCKESITEEL